MSADRSTFYTARLLATLFVTFIFVAACASPPRVPFTLAEQRMAVPPGFADVRISASEQEGAERLMTFFQRERMTRDRPLEILALSGGGANGAFGAGVLYGWTQRGDRPAFDVVTGISTGALAAPFAFLGSDYDDELKSGYTDGQSSNILDFLGVLALFRPSLFSGGPLETLVQDLIDDTLVAAVAKEHAAGRRLLIGTTNLDTQSLTLWNMGAVAAVGGPRATKLFRSILIASSSIPGIFPPVMIEVESGGRRFAEMHVDGSAIASFFAVPEPLLLWTAQEKLPHPANLYVLMNGALDADFEVTPAETIAILRRSVDVAGKTNNRTQLAAVAAFAGRNNVDLRVSSVPPGVRPSPLDFDQKRMSALFEYGRQAASNGAAWRSLTDDAP